MKEKKTPWSHVNRAQHLQAAKLSDAKDDILTTFLRDPRFYGCSVATSPLANQAKNGVPVETIAHGAGLPVEEVEGLIAWDADFRTAINPVNEKIREWEEETGVEMDLFLVTVTEGKDGE